jgi:hypothetical protein
MIDTHHTLDGQQQSLFITRREEKGGPQHSRLALSLLRIHRKFARLTADGAFFNVLPPTSQHL